MALYSSILEEDIRQVCSDGAIPWEKLRGKTLLITGASGLIGKNLIYTLLAANAQKHLDLTITALVRDRERAAEQFPAPGRALRFVEGRVEKLPDIPGDADYIIHGASPTASAYFVQHPLETIRTAVWGTWDLLELARQKGAEGFLYLSSMEVYGANTSDGPIGEDAPAFIDPMKVRSCYPEAKRLCENLCAGHWSEHRVPAKAIRLAQTFGTGVAADDARVFAQFVRSVLKDENIVLKTDGTARQSYLYTSDAVSAILTVLLCGEPGEAYNAANPDTCCSILEMAEMVARDLAQGRIRVEIRPDPEGASIYPPPRRVDLRTDKLYGLGWRPVWGLQGMFRRMYEDLLERRGDR